MNRNDSMLSSGYSAQGNTVPPLNACVPGLLVLARHPLQDIYVQFQQSRLSAEFHMDCVPNAGLRVDLQRYQAVIMAGMTNEELGKISTGICDTPYTAMASEAILRNKRIYIPIEQIELYQYACSAPTAYYDYLHSRISMLSDSGIAICTTEDLENCILDELAAGIQPAPVYQQPSAPVSPIPREPVLQLEKRVITERDILEAVKSGIRRIQIPARAVVTSVADELASSRGIALIRV